MEKFYVVNENAMLNELEAQGVIFCQSEKGDEKIYYLNDTSMSVVLFLQTGKKRLIEIVDEIIRLYDVNFEECKSDIEVLLKDLEMFKIIDVIIE